MLEVELPTEKGWLVGVDRDDLELGGGNVMR